MLEKNDYGFVTYAKIVGEEGHIHEYSYAKGCACMVCNECEDHVQIGIDGDVRRPYSHCWCGWKPGGGGLTAEEHAEFAMEFEDYEY